MILFYIYILYITKVYPFDSRENRRFLCFQLVKWCLFLWDHMTGSSGFGCFWSRFLPCDQSSLLWSALSASRSCHRERRAVCSLIPSGSSVSVRSPLRHGLTWYSIPLGDTGYPGPGHGDSHQHRKSKKDCFISISLYIGRNRFTRPVCSV